MFITHLHLDHICGLLMTPYIFKRDAKLDIYGPKDTSETLNSLFNPPVWPVNLNYVPAVVNFKPFLKETKIGDIVIKSSDGVHPGGIKLLRIEYKGKVISIMTDCTLTSEKMSVYEEIAKDADLLLIDGQYNSAEWPTVSGFGHNTYNMATIFAQKCCAKKTLITHHSNTRTDSELDSVVLPSGMSFAKEGEKIDL